MVEPSEYLKILGGKQISGATEWQPKNWFGGETGRWLSDKSFYHNPPLVPFNEDDMMPFLLRLPLYSLVEPRLL
jgi:hypothetical protein